MESAERPDETPTNLAACRGDRAPSQQGNARARRDDNRATTCIVCGTVAAACATDATDSAHSSRMEALRLLGSRLRAERRKGNRDTRGDHRQTSPPSLLAFRIGSGCI